ncbi:unnamed protein product [Schistosoma margrebowiei]|uniref:Uncharacterized protein n=1 Tax=Schistosoma margrebowiei TaxID=48269 RepID=A0A183MZX0_9TREM|nr:unnamed protein product [Schistosoma margrebowiei]
MYLRELVLPGGFDFVSPSFTVRDVTTELSELRPTSYRTEIRTMTPHDESRIPSEVTRPMPLLTTRATIYLGTWNVRTVWNTGRAFQIAAEMRIYNLEVLGISGTHWTQVGQ